MLRPPARKLGFNMEFLLQSSLRISPPLPFLPLSGVSRDPLKMGVGSRLEQDQAALAAVTSSPASASKRWPGASAWPSWDLLDSPEDPFSIEREARLHRQAAGKSGGGSQQASVPGGGTGWPGLSLQQLRGSMQACFWVHEQVEKQAEAVWAAASLLQIC